MKITKNQLRRIIKEEKIKLLKESRRSDFGEKRRQEVWYLHERLMDLGVNDSNILEYVLGNWMAGHDAEQVLSDYLTNELGEEL